MNKLLKIFTLVFFTYKERPIFPRYVYIFGFSYETDIHI